MKRSKTLYFALLICFLLIAGGTYYLHGRSSGNMVEPEIKFNATNLKPLNSNLTLVYRSREYSNGELVQNSTRIFTISRKGNDIIMVERFRTEWWQPSYSLYEGTTHAEIANSTPIIYQPDGSIFVKGKRAEVDLFRIGYPYSPVFEQLKAEKGYTLRLCCANLTVENVRTINGRECIIVKAETEDVTLKLVIDAKTRLLLWRCGLSGDQRSCQWEEWLISSK
ncbi:hypothetical protein ADU37_CDS02580 [Thermococcus sp. 2319x1]|uniref:hypothetical protein n=1 Tax=Thermococcus sp. 2319x1 TaxID=1674923 RepID=UPI00073AA826|nr:hypothetical protein [Thermococcus sp. 2319x1]ALV61957.1 hypothetical protein ADU37_CDS02580 [Thermococcus sp. 2319x1]